MTDSMLVPDLIMCLENIRQQDTLVCVRASKKLFLTIWIENERASTIEKNEANEEAMMGRLI